MPEQINPKYKKEVMHAVEYHFPDAKIILFGSRAWGKAKEESDIDIAIDNHGKPIHPREIVRMKNTMENLTVPLNVDIVDLNSIEQSFKELILTKGIVWDST
jgi:predicted nucleotidyltransferase